MISPSGSRFLTLRHQPYGEQHPYDPQPYERFPRDPSSGEPVTLGVETNHFPKAEKVWCVWQVDGNPMVNQTDAANHTIGETTDLWQVHLPAFNGGEVVRYRLIGQNEKQQIESEEFSFSVSTWVDVISIYESIENGETLVVKMATSYPGLYVQLQAKSDIKGTISLQLTTCNQNSPLPPTQFLKDSLCTKLGDVSITLQFRPLRLVLYRESDGLVLQSANSIQVLVCANGTVARYKIGFDSPSDEAFYGFGERFNALDQRGNKLDNHVYSQYTSQGKRSYIPIPFFISSRGYGLWLKTERQAEFDLAATENNCWTLIGHVEEDSSLEMKFFYQKNPSMIVQAFTDLTGKPKLPPPWAFGLWMSSNDWNSQAEVMHQLQMAQKFQIPATVLVIEAWSDEINFYIWNDARYMEKSSSDAYSLNEYTFPAAGHWPNPKAMIDELHQAGVRLVLWQIPVMKYTDPIGHFDETQKNSDQKYAIQHRFVVQKADGSPHRIETHAAWFSKSLVLDFTNQRAVDWWFKKRKYLLAEMGVDGFKTDGGEHIWDRETRFENSMRGNRGINYYPIAYEGAYDRFLEAHRGRDHVLFSRAGYTGVQQVSLHWTGDEKSTWDAFRATLCAMLNVGLCGISFIGWDMAGFGGELPSSELYSRAVAASVFCPIMQFHSEHSDQNFPCQDRTPWNMQEATGESELISLFRQFANLRMNLIPYILSQAWLANQSGFPLMRALPIQFPNDTACRHYPLEYCFGEALLIAPIVEPGKMAWQVYLPQGDWRDIWTGEVQKGPQVIETPASLSFIPAFQRKGTIMPLNLGKDLTLCSPVGNAVDHYQNLCLFIYPDKNCEVPLFNGTWDEVRWVRCSRSDEIGQLEIYLPPMEDTLHIFLFEVQALVVLCDGKLLPKSASRQKNTSPSGWTIVPEKRLTQIALLASPCPMKLTIQYR